MRTKNELYQEAMRTVAARRQMARARAEDARAEAEAAVDADGRSAADGVVRQVDLADLFEEGRGLGVDLVGQGGLIFVLEDCFEFRQNLCHFGCFLSFFEMFV